MAYSGNPPEADDASAVRAQTALVSFASSEIDYVPYYKQFMCLEIFIVVTGVAGFVTFVLWHVRRRSIVSIPARNRHFRRLAKELQFKVTGDDYFLQLEGNWNGVPVIVYPHNFEGPGMITLFYADTGVPFVDQSWIEPSLSLGRAIVEVKSGGKYQFEFAGNPALNSYPIVEILERYREHFAYLAITLPSRFAYSQFVMETLSKSANYIALAAMDSGRRPSIEELEESLDAITNVSKTVQSVLKA